MELNHDTLRFTFPEVHPDARMRIRFADLLSPGHKLAPLCHVDDYSHRLPPRWIRDGAVMLPVNPSQAMCLVFDTSGYPFAIKTAVGTTNTVTGKLLHEGLNRDPQDYIVAPPQTRLIGYCAESGSLRQFRALPPGTVDTAKVQIMNDANHDSVQIIVHPMKRESWERHIREFSDDDHANRRTPPVLEIESRPPAPLIAGAGCGQPVCADPHGLEDWDLRFSSSCLVHLVNSLEWQFITGSEPRRPTSTTDE